MNPRSKPDPCSRFWGARPTWPCPVATCRRIVRRPKAQFFGVQQNASDCRAGSPPPPNFQTGSKIGTGLPSTGRGFHGCLWLLALALAPALHAAKIGDLGQTVWKDQAVRFLTLADPAVRYAVAGTILLGIACGLLGSFLVVRRMALAGDALSHAVLPGVALGFLWNMSKDPVAIFVGATIAGLLGTATVWAILRTTRLKEDTALGMVLAGYFALGMCLTTMFQRLPSGNKSGLDKFLFGQAAALGPNDVALMAVVTVGVLLVVAVAYKELLVVCFDPGFSRVCGLASRWIEHVLLLLLAFSVVIALQAVGVVLVSAMLVTPAATAYLLTDRFHHMLFWSAALGMVSGLVGAFCSFLGATLPTGPFMVLAASGIFALVFLFAPQRGVVPRWWRSRSQGARIGRENTLKAIYQILEQEGFRGDAVSLRELAERRRLTLEQALAESRALVTHQLAGVRDESVALTPAGWERACAIVRNHRLWELFLTNAAQIAPDHVHEDAEKIEHVLGEDVVRQLERRLQYADRDPHGRPIPSLADIRGRGDDRRAGRATGFGDRS
jgi:ABC-type Mn2+/Zn2+ transport system permease subunit/Mn-dependent DtxR family transcriptional regulator